MVLIAATRAEGRLVFFKRTIIDKYKNTKSQQISFCVCKADFFLNLGIIFACRDKKHQKEIFTKTISDEDLLPPP